MLTRCLFLSLLVYQCLSSSECPANDRSCLAQREGIDLKEQEEQFSSPAEEEDVESMAAERERADAAVSSLYSEAVAAYNSGDFTTALRKLRVMTQKAPFILPAHVALLKAALKVSVPAKEVVDVVTTAIECAKDVKRMGIQEDLVQKFCMELLSVVKIAAENGQVGEEEMRHMGRTVKHVCSTKEEDVFLEDLSHLELLAHPKVSTFDPGLMEEKCREADVEDLEILNFEIDRHRPQDPEIDELDVKGNSPRVCMCGFVEEGTNAMLLDWVKAHRCMGISKFVLVDGRNMNATETAVRDWMLQPYMKSKLVEMAFVGPEEAKPSRKASTSWAWNIDRAEWLAVRQNELQSSLLAETCDVSCSAYDWQIALPAPSTALLGRLQVLRNLPKEVSEVVLPAVEYFPPKQAEQKPPRPLFVTHTSTLPTLTSCKREEDSSMILACRESARLKRTHQSRAPAGTSVVVLPSEGLRLAKFGSSEAAGVGEDASDAVEDFTPYKRYKKCNRRELSIAEDIAGAQKEIELGSGAVLIPGALGGVEAIEIRERILKFIPSFKQRRRVNVFQNHLCQITRGHEEVSSGWDKRCEPLDPRVIKLAYNANVLKVVRSLLGTDAIVHNVGMSIAGAMYVGPLNTHQDQPLPTGSMHVWGGRNPPPTHALSVQVLWLLEDVSFVNAPTYVMPGTQGRTERLDKWKENATADAVDNGLFPVTFLSGEAGDAFVTLGSIWHGASTNLSREPRLVLLIEYCPSFVEPLHTFREEFINARVPAEHRKLFRTSLAAKIHAAATSKS